MLVPSVLRVHAVPVGGCIARLLCLIGLVRAGRFELKTFSFMMKGQCCVSPLEGAVQSSCLDTS